MWVRSHGVQFDRRLLGPLLNRRAEHFVEQQRVAGRANHRALDDVLELAHVAGPGIALQRRHHRVGTCLIWRPSLRWRCWMKNQTSSGMSSRRSRSGGSRTGNTLRR